MQGVLQLAQRIADGAPNDPNRFEDWLPFNATNWWIRPMDNGEWFCRVFVGPHIDTRVAVLAILMHWQQRMDADGDAAEIIVGPSKENPSQVLISDVSNPWPFSTMRYPDRAAALCAYVAHKIGASHA